MTLFVYLCCGEARLRLVESPHRFFLCSSVAKLYDATGGGWCSQVRYAAAKDENNGRAAVRELKQLVKTCHQQGLEVGLARVIPERISEEIQINFPRA